MGLAELLAAKKKAAQDAAKPAAETTIPTEVATAAVAAAAQAPMTFAEKLAARRAEKAQAIANKVQKASPIAAMEEPSTETVAQPNKPLTFAEKMAAKKQEIAEAQKAAPAPADIDPSRIPANPDEAQSFADIVSKIRELHNLMEDDLKEGMSALKVALKKNPAASDLLLDEEIGLMVVALRRIRGVAVSEASKEKKPGRKPKAKDVQLTAEELNAAWAEL